MTKATVIGIGAMGGGMARQLRDAGYSVDAYDKNVELLQDFYTASRREEEEDGGGGASTSDDKKQSARAALPAKLADVIHADTKAIFLVLLNEQQCESVCFETDDCLRRLAPPGCLLFVCATVTAQWIMSANERLGGGGGGGSSSSAESSTSSSLILIDCPTSGGPVRARQGDLSLMVSFANRAEHEPLARPYLDVLARPGSVHVIEGRIGMGSTVKMVHQLLAGVHICAAAEALALAAAAGLNVRQVYEIVNGAAGASWMFQDRGARMMMTTTLTQRPDVDNDNDPVGKDVAEEEEVKSRLDIFVKDLDIVYQEARRLKAPIPLASTALQQFISGQSLGLGAADDSQVVRVYEAITGAKVRQCGGGGGDIGGGGGGGAATGAKPGSNVGDLWVLEDGTNELIVEVGAEPRHQVVLHNNYVRVLRVAFPPNDTTLAHRHAEDSLYVFLVEHGLTVINHVQGRDPACDCMAFGEVRYGSHKSEGPPLVHRITNQSPHDMLCIDAELLARPPITSAFPLLLLVDGGRHELIKTRDKCRVYQLTLPPGESCTVDYPFFYLSVVVQPSVVRSQRDARLGWEERRPLGDVSWCEPTLNLQKTNLGDTVFREYIVEWR